MKSAFELAMERLGGGLRQYTEEQKEKLAEIDRLQDSRAAQARFDAAARRRRADADAEVLRQIDEELALELRSIAERRERRKEELRRQFEGDGSAG